MLNDSIILIFICAQRPKRWREGEWWVFYGLGLCVFRAIYVFMSLCYIINYFKIALCNARFFSLDIKSFVGFSSFQKTKKYVQCRVVLPLYQFIATEFAATFRKDKKDNKIQNNCCHFIIGTKPALQL